MNERARKFTRLEVVWAIILVLVMAAHLSLEVAEAKTTKDSTKLVVYGGKRADKSSKKSQDDEDVLWPQDFEPTEPADIPQQPTDPTDIPMPIESDGLIYGPDSVKALYATLAYGDKVSIEPGTVYYESAAFGGSGKTGYIGNEYTQGALYVGGFCVIDDTGVVQRNEVRSREEAMRLRSPQPDVFSTAYAGLTWVAVFTDGFTTGDLGWLPRSAVKLEPSEDVSTTPSFQNGANLEDEDLRGDILDPKAEDLNGNDSRQENEDFGEGDENPSNMDEQEKMDNRSRDPEVFKLKPGPPVK